MPDSSRSYQHFGLRLGGALLVCMSLAACSSVNRTSNSIVGMVSPYKIDIVQGNFVSREQAAAVTRGMAREQVRAILGSPLLASVFHAERWDYVFTFRRQGVDTQSRRVTVYFKGDGVERIEADDLPTESEFVATLGGTRRFGSVPPLEASPEDLKKFPAPAAAVAAPLPPLPASYPPLEPVARP